MADIRQHRGPHPADRELFAEDQLPPLRAAVSELSWLLTRGYATKSALKIVGDRHRLTERQRLALARAACADQSLSKRKSTVVAVSDVSGKDIVIDGFNLIITVEAALSGGIMLVCRDESIRDLSSVHGSYRAVTETDAGIVLIGEELEKLGVKSVEWLLDQPISNSGRLAKLIRDLAERYRWLWTVELLFNPDERIASSGKIAITSDAVVLDRVGRWVNFKRHLIDQRLLDSWVIDLR